MLKRVRNVVFGFFTLLLVLLGIWFLLMITIGPGLVEPALVLAIGWTRFLARTVPKATWNWDLVLMGVLCSALVVFIAQRLLDWLTRQIAVARGKTWRWPWKWTLCGLMAVGLCFLVGMSVGGIVHQVGWLSSQTESWHERKGEAFLDMRQLDMALQESALDAPGDVEEMRRALRNPESGYFHKRSGEASLLERFHLLLIVEETNSIKGSIIFPRDLTRRSRSGGMYQFGDKRDYFDMEELPELIKKHQKQLLAL